MEDGVAQVRVIATLYALVLRVGIVRAARVLVHCEFPIPHFFTIARLVISLFAGFFVFVMRSSC